MNYKVIVQTFVYSLDDKNHLHQNGKPFPADTLLTDLTDQTITINSKVYRLFKSLASCVADSDITPVNVITPPFRPIDATVSAWTDWLPLTAWSECANGVQVRQEQRTRYVVTAAQHGGATPPLSEQRQNAQACEVLPPPNPNGPKSSNANYYNTGVDVTVFVDPHDLSKWKGVLKSDPTKLRPLTVTDVEIVPIASVGWVQILSYADTSLIGGWIPFSGVLYGNPAIGINYQKVLA